MNDGRLLQVLRDIAIKRAPHILNNQTWQSDKAGIRYLATYLVNNDYLVLVGYVPPRLIQQTDVLARDWQQHFLRFYDLFANQLFRTFADREIELHTEAAYQVAILHGKARDLLLAMANYLVPYLDARSHHLVSMDDHQIHQILREMLTELGGKHISPQVFELLMTSGTAIVHDMVSQPMIQKSLTDFKRPIIQVKQRPMGPLPRTSSDMPPKHQVESVNGANGAGSPPDSDKPKSHGETDYSLPRFSAEDTGISTVTAETDTKQSTQPNKRFPFPRAKKNPGLPYALGGKNRTAPDHDDEE